MRPDDKSVRGGTPLLRMILAAMLLAMAYLLPFLTGQIPRFGKMLCPMHIPVLLCGFLCGPWWGITVGMVAPLLRSLTLGAPVFFPQAVCMALELGAYGAASGLLYRYVRYPKCRVYVSLLLAMTVGRMVWGGAMLLCVGFSGGRFGWSAFLSGALLQTIPGIVLQLLLIPPIVRLAESYFRKD